MEGGLFGLSKAQVIYLYISQIIPTLIVLYQDDILTIFAIIEIFYILATLIYISINSLEKSIHPYLFNELTKMDYQVQKGITLGLSAFLLVAIYGIIILSIGKVVLPQSVTLGPSFHHLWYLVIPVSLINPLLEEWYWRIFLPKTFQSTYYKSHLINITYLMFHLALFSKYLGFWRALPFVGSFFSLGRSMSYIKQKYGIISSIITHYGITVAGFVLLVYIRIFTNVKI